MASTGVVLREAHLRVQLANRLALKYGVSLVRGLLANKDGPLHSPEGMTTDEIYKFALQQTPSADFYNPHLKDDKPLTTVPTPRTKGKKRSPPPPPPNPEHPVRSKVFLKKSILQYLVGTQELAKVRAVRVLAVPTTSKKGKKDPVSEEEARPKETIWVWKAVEAADPAKIKPSPPPKSPYLADIFNSVRAAEVSGRDIGVGEDFGHLSTRRQRARLDKIRIDAQMLKKRQQEAIQEEKYAARAAPKKLQAERAAKKSRQEQDWEDRRLAARKPLAKSRK
ncbi:hypothetical protein C0993_001186 [Termitomyces sp. T159_Od127]|nr:hypothetical protein C0993_001186 [Termitomyces sp. T159_Od127]